MARSSAGDEMITGSASLPLLILDSLRLRVVAFTVWGGSPTARSLDGIQRKRTARHTAAEQQLRRARGRRLSQRRAQGRRLGGRMGLEQVQPVQCFRAEFALCR